MRLPRPVSKVLAARSGAQLKTMKRERHLRRPVLEPSGEKLDVLHPVFKVMSSKAPVLSPMPR